MTTDPLGEINDYDEYLRLLYENARRMEAANDVISESQKKHGRDPYDPIIIYDGDDDDDPVLRAMGELRTAIGKQAEIMAMLPNRLTDSE